MTLPKFDFSGMTLKTDDELNDALKGAATVPFFKPGKHDVTIVSSEYLGAASDDTWGKVRVKYEGTGGKEISDLLMIPFKDITTYKTKKGTNSTIPGRKIVSFLKALGAEVTIARLGDTLKTYFAKDNSLVGLNMAIEVGYSGNHLAYVGKNDAGEPMVAIVDRDENRVQGHPTFSTYDEGRKYAEENNVALEAYVNVLGYAAPATPNKLLSSNW